jgi:hypothetical protein
MAVEVLLPVLNPFNFTQVESIDYKDIFPNIDNRLFEDDSWLDSESMNYKDKFLKEAYYIQMFANFGLYFTITNYFKGQIFDSDGVQILDFTSTHKKLNTSNSIPVPLFHRFTIDFTGFTTGCYYGKITIYDGNATTILNEFYTDLFEITDAVEEYIKFEGFHSENDFGWIFTDEANVETPIKFYLPGSMADYKPAQTKEIYKDDLAEVFALDTKPERIWNCNIFAVPSHILDRLNLFFSLNQIKINDIQYQNNGGLNSERLKPGNLFDINVDVAQRNWNYYRNIPDSDTYEVTLADIEDGGFDNLLYDHKVIKDGGFDDDLDAFNHINE